MADGHFQGRRARTVLSLVAGVVAGLTLLGGTGCKRKEAADRSAALSSAAGNEAGARALAKKFLADGADKRALTRELRPRPEDFTAVFNPDMVELARKHYADLWEQGMVGREGKRTRYVIAPKSGETEITVVAVTSDAIKAGKAKRFARGWAMVAPHLKAGLTFYQVRFTKPGEQRGTRIDGLVHVNGRWVVFPRIWRITPR